MKLPLMILGTVCLISGAYMSFMLVAFWGGALAGGRTARWIISSANFLLLALPAACVIGLIPAWIAYFKSWGRLHYLWFLLPLPFTLYLFYLMFWATTKH